MNEGCLSVPEVTVEMKRPAKIRVRCQDYKGDFHEIEAEGFLSHVFQHEIDHLHGVMIVDYLTPIKRTLINKQLKKIANGDNEE